MTRNELIELFDEANLLDDTELEFLFESGEIKVKEIIIVTSLESETLAILEFE